MKLRKFFMGMAAAVLVLGLSACGKKAADTQDTTEKAAGLKIVTTFYPMYDFAKNVADADDSVELLIPSGTEPHDYEPSAKDIAKIQDADVFIYNSDDMETWVASALESIDAKKVKVIMAADGIDFIENEAAEEEEHDHDHETEGTEEEEHDHVHAIDPHVWLDPVLAQTEVANIRDGLIAANSAGKDTYTKNAKTYTEKLEALNGEFAAAFKNATNRTFVTQHAAFAYLAARYDLTQNSISGLSPDQEPSASALAEIEDYVKANNVKVIFTEEIASPKIAETVASATGASLEVLSPIEGITDEDQKAGLDYIGVMQKNLKALQEVIK